MADQMIIVKSGEDKGYAVIVTDNYPIDVLRY